MTSFEWFSQAPVEQSSNSRVNAVRPKRTNKAKRQGVQMYLVLDYIKVNPNLTTHQIAVGMGKTDTWVSSHTQNLEAIGLVGFYLARSPRRECNIKYWRSI